MTSASSTSRCRSISPPGCWRKNKTWSDSPCPGPAEGLGRDATEALLAQGGGDDLPELPNSGWEESALIAAGLCDSPDDFIRTLIPANLHWPGAVPLRQAR